MKINSRVTIMREAVVKIVKLISTKNIRVTQQGARAFVEYHPKTLVPTRVNIPYMPDDASDELLDAVQGFLDHEVAHILFTDPSAIAKAQKAGVANIHNIIEDSFIERKMAEKFAGSGHNLAKVGAFVLERYTTPALKENPDTAAAVLMMPMIRAWAGQTVFKDYMADKWHLVADVVEKLGPDAPAMIANAKNSADCVKAAVEFKTRLSKKEKKEEPVPTPPSPEKGEDKGEGKGKPSLDDTPPPPSDEPDDDTPPPGDEDDAAPEDKTPEPPADDTDEDDEDDGVPDPTKAEAPDASDLVSDMAEEEREPEPEPEPEREPEPEPEPEHDDSADAGFEPEPEPDDSDDSDDSADDRTDDEDEGPGDEEGEGISASGSGSGDEGDEGEDRAGGDAADDEDTPEHDMPDYDPSAEGSDADPGSEPGAMPDTEDADVPSMFDDLEKEGAFKDFDETVSEELTKDMIDTTRDSEYLIYTKDHDKVEPLDVHDPESLQPYLKHMQDTVDGMVGVMQKDMERIMAARSQVIWTGGHRSGRLHGPGLARLQFGRDDVFRRKQENQSKDVAVELLVDASGSMRCNNRIQVAAYAAYALSAVLQRMGISNEILAFTTKMFPASVRAEMNKERDTTGLKRRSYSRQEALWMPVIKSFNEQLDITAKERLVALHQEVVLRENVDGECVQIAANRLMRRRESRKILIVLSDGEPACGDGVWEEQIRHLKQVAKQIEDRKVVELVGIGIETASVKKFYKNNVVLNNVADLPVEVMGQLKKLLFK